MYFVKFQQLILKNECDRIPVMKIKRRIVPKYSYIPIVICLVWNTLVYNVSRIFTDLLPHYDFSLKIDGIIPYVPYFIFIYVLSYGLWVVGFVIFARENRTLCNEMFAAEFISKTICLLCFTIIPTEMVRASNTGDGVFNLITNMVYSFDEPNNLFPSIHCMESWICFRGAMKCKKIHSAYISVWFVLALLICASTVLVKQHLFVDIFAGILVAEIGMFLSEKLAAGRLYDVLRIRYIMYIKSKKRVRQK